MTMISRVGFCKRCFKEQRPKTDQIFVVSGKQYRYYHSKNIGNFGYTPHFYKLIKSIGENIVYERLCGMHCCGVEVYYDPNTGKNSHTEYKEFWERGIMTRDSWNGLIKFFGRDSGYDI